MTKYPCEVRFIWNNGERIWARVWNGREEHDVYTSGDRSAEGAIVRRAVDAWSEALPTDPVKRATALLHQVFAERTRREVLLREAAASFATIGVRHSLDSAVIGESQIDEIWESLVRAVGLIMPEAFDAWRREEREERVTKVAGI